MSDSAIPSPDTVLVQLVDTNSGRAVQTWRFDTLATISIGRAPERDVSLTDPYVSRHHADLRFQDGCWTLLALSKNGVLVNGRNVSESPLQDGSAFRLGTSGPVLRFSMAENATREQATLSGAEFPKELLLDLNTTKRDDEVRDITDSEYFQELQKRARVLREQRETS